MSTTVLSRRVRRPVSPRAPLVLALIAVVCLALGYLSELTPSTPTYDPWAWLIWGRDILHLSLNTNYGPSWKPLPVAFTTIFALIPSAAPLLWLGIARAGALAALVLAFRVARRLGGGWPGGLVAAASLASVSAFASFGALGDSEGLLVALLLAAVDMHLTGHRRAALWLAFGACLLRFEAWPFAGLYALWLWRAEPGTRRTIVGMVIAGAALWFLPEWWGSGDPLRGGSRAQNNPPGTAADARYPILEVLRRYHVMLPWIAQVGVVGAVVAGAVRAVRSRPLVLMGGAALAWALLVGLMAQDGFAGSTRYLIAPSGLACVAAGALWGRVAALVPRLLGPPILIAASVALLWSPAGKISGDLSSARNEAHLDARLSDAVAAAGGRHAILACGAVTIGPYQVSALAWRLHAQMDRVGYMPELPGSVFRGTRGRHAITGSPWIPLHDPRWKQVAQANPWEVLTACKARNG